MADSIITEVRQWAVAITWRVFRDLILFVVQVVAVALLGFTTAYLMYAGVYWLWLRLIELLVSLVGIPVEALQVLGIWVWRLIVPQPLTRAEKIMNTVDKVGGTLYRAAEIPVTLVDSMVGLDILLSCLIWSIVVVLSVYSLKKILGVIKRVQLRRRGLVVTGEAMNEGSSFVISPAPSHVVEIMRPGLLIDDLVGLGSRVMDWLVLPGHVYQEAGGDEGIILRGPKTQEKIPLRAVHKQSLMYSDVVYVKVPITVWSALGVSRVAAAARVRDPTAATTWGHLGKTVGMVGRMSDSEFLMYSGSTVPGYSGASYMSTATGSWIGMHIGAVQAKTTNVGVRADILEMEVKAANVEWLAINPEGFRNAGNGSQSTSSSSSERKAQGANKRYDEEDQAIMEKFRSVYPLEHKNAGKGIWSGVSKDEDFKPKGGFQLGDWADELDDEALTSPSKTLKAIFTQLPSSDQRDVLVLLQTIALNPSAKAEVADGESPRGGPVLLVDKSAQARVQALEARLRAVEERLEAAESLLAKTEPIEVKASEPVQPKQPKEKKKAQAKAPVVEAKADSKDVSAEGEAKAVVPEAKARIATPPKKGKCPYCTVETPTMLVLRRHIWFRHQEEKRREVRKNPTVKLASKINGEAIADNDEDPIIATSGTSFLEKGPAQKSKKL